MSDFTKVYKRIKIFLKKKKPRQKLLEMIPKGAVAAEIGVWRGDFSKRIIDVTSPKELHLIDPWAFQSDFPQRIYGGREAKKQKDMNNIYTAVMERFQENRNVIIHRDFSEFALKEFKDGYFDWVYIDGNHHYDYVLKDLEISYLKVKSKGFIAGDDYTSKAEEGFPVERAVQDFVEKKGLQRHLKIIKSQFIIKK